MHSYIDQYQDLLDAPLNIGERKDVEVYYQAVRTATSEHFTRRDEPQEGVFTNYIQRAPLQYLDNSVSKDSPLGGFNYERWLGVGSQR